jgi:energy-coupling factor transport system ATP-binding protein
MLEARGLTVGYPGAPPLLDGLDLALAPGEQVALTGPNGCGKSTLCLALAGLVEPRAGEVRVDGEPCRPGSRERAAVGILFQEPDSQLITPTVEAELAFPLENLGWERARIAPRVERLLAQFGLERLRDRATARLSGGEKSRLALAAALAAGPRYLLLDEPEVYLDAAARRRLRELLAHEVAQGLGILWVTQTDDEWAAAARRFRLERGILVPALSATVAPIPSAAGPGTSPRNPGRSAVARHRLAARGLTFSYGSEPLLSCLDLGVLAGETVLIGGESGSGKSTLLLLLAGVLDPQSGTIDIEAADSGTELAGVGTGAATPPLGVALQSPEDQLVQPTVLEDVALGPRLCGLPPDVADARARRAMAEAGLDASRHGALAPGGLSLGQRRRAAWAGIWAMGARLWLLDEPTAGLDAEGTSTLENAVRNFTESGGAVVLVHQDPRLDRWPGRRLRLSGGRLAGESPSSCAEPNARSTGPPAL